MKPTPFHYQLGDRVVLIASPEEGAWSVIARRRSVFQVNCYDLRSTEADGCLLVGVFESALTPEPIAAAS